MAATMLTDPHAASHADPAWRQRVQWAVFACAVLLPMLWFAEFKPWVLIDAQALQSTASFAASFWPPAHDADFLWLTLVAAWQTVAIATAGLSLALLLGVPLAIAACDTLSVSALPTGRMSWFAASVRRAVRGLLVVMRSVPELVWALLLVRVVGLGPTAGVLAIALSYSGMLGKVFAEVVDSAPRAASRALLLQGASPWSTLLHGVLPQSAAELVSYTLFRWECAVRGTVMMGFVGAGGLGQQMEISMKMFAGGEVVTLLLVFVALVAVADALSNRLRAAL